MKTPVGFLKFPLKNQDLLVKIETLVLFNENLVRFIDEIEESKVKRRIIKFSKRAKDL